MPFYIFQKDAPIHPTSPSNLAWIKLMSILTLVLFSTIPLCLGLKKFSEVFFILNTTIDFIFIVDIVKTFLTGTVDENGVVNMDLETISENYLEGNCRFDVAASIPLDLMCFMKTGTFTNVPKVHLILKLLFRIRRVKQVDKLFDKFFYSILQPFGWDKRELVTILKGIVYYLFMAHWAACFSLWLVEAFDYPDVSWLVYHELHKEPLFVQWHVAFLRMLSLMTPGYGRIIYPSACNDEHHL